MLVDSGYCRFNRICAVRFFVRLQSSVFRITAILGPLNSLVFLHVFPQLYLRFPCKSFISLLRRSRGKVHQENRPEVGAVAGDFHLSSAEEVAAAGEVAAGNRRGVVVVAVAEAALLAAVEPAPLRA